MYYKHFENITLDDIIHPNIAVTAQIFYCIITPINTVLIAVFSYIILKKSPPAMNLYKHILIVKLLACYSHNIINFLWQPIPLYPLRAMYCIGFVCDGPVINVIMTVCFLSVVSFIVYIALFQLLFQCVNTSLIENELLKRMFLDKRSIYVSLLTSLFSSLGFDFAIFILSVHENMDAAFVADIPALGPFVDATPSFDGLHPDYDSNLMTAFLGIILLFIAGTMTGATILFIAFVRHMRKIKKTITPSTYEGFCMMFKSMVAQLVLFLFFLVIPNALSNGQLAFEGLWTSYITPLLFPFGHTNIISCNFNSQFELFSLELGLAVSVSSFHYRSHQLFPYLSTMLQVEEGLAYNDLKSVILEEADLKRKGVGQFLNSPKFDVPNSDGLKWWIRVYPAGNATASHDHISVYLYVNKPVKCNIRFLIDDSSIQESGSHEFTDPPIGWGWSQYASHENLRPLFRDGKLKITGIVEFDVATQCRFQQASQPSSSVPLIYQLFRHVTTDVELVVGSDRVPAHRGFLSLISPVFHAMFSHDIVESKLDKVEIVDFDFATVKSVIDYCYGHELQNPSVEATVNILRFGDKYIITAAIEELEKLPSLIPSTVNFCQIIRYAFDCNRDTLLAECCSFFKGHKDEIKDLSEFADLPPTLVVDLLKKAFDLKTDFNVLTHAHKHGIGFVVDHLEEPFIKSMTIDNFCSAVTFAWECSRDNLKQVCAAFFINNREKVTDSEDFINLPPETVCEVLKAAHALKRVGV
uniref:MATH domain-containing protein n=1 Tax=Panagrellus redivivus TaxID=6233 RepID=A0A7E4ZSM6_PANRE